MNPTHIGPSGTQAAFELRRKAVGGRQSVTRDEAVAEGENEWIG